MVVVSPRTRCSLLLGEALDEYVLLGRLGEPGHPSRGLGGGFRHVCRNVEVEATADALRLPILRSSIKDLTQGCEEEDRDRGPVLGVLGLSR